MSISLSDIILKRFAIEYEVVVDEKGKLAVSVNYLYDFEKKILEIYHANTHWWLGMKVEYFPIGQYKSRFYLGFELKLISLSSIYYMEGEGSKKYYHDKIKPYVLFWMGFRYDFLKNYTISLNTGISIQKADGAFIGYEGLLIGNVGIGYKF